MYSSDSALCLRLKLLLELFLLLLEGVSTRFRQALKYFLILVCCLFFEEAGDFTSKVRKACAWPCLNIFLTLDALSCLMNDLVLLDPEPICENKFGND